MAKRPNAAVCKTAIHRFESDRRLHEFEHETGPRGRFRRSWRRRALAVGYVRSPLIVGAVLIFTTSIGLMRVIMGPAVVLIMINLKP